MTQSASRSTASNPRDEALQGQNNGWPTGMMVVLALAAMVISIAGLKFISSIFAPAFLALSLVIAVRPIRLWLVQRGMKPLFAALITMVLLFALLILLIGSLVYSVYALVNILPTYTEKFQGIYEQSITTLGQFGVTQNQISDEALKVLEPGKIMSWMTTALSGVSATGSLLFVVVMVMAFLLVDSGIVKNRSDFLRKHNPALAEAFDDFQFRTNRYWLVNTIFGLIVAIINVIALMILGVPLAIVWGIFSFVTNYIPNIGFVLGMIPPALIALVDGDVTTMIWVIVLFSVINFTMQQIVQPKVTGDAVGLNTTVTFLSLLFWATTEGALGAILAVPLTLFFKALLIDADPRTRWISVFLTTDFDKKNKLRSVGSIDAAARDNDGNEVFDDKDAPPASVAAE